MEIKPIIKTFVIVFAAVIVASMVLPTIKAKLGV